MADRVITASAVISAKDETGSVFANIGKKIDNIGKAAKNSASIDAMAKSLERAQAQMKAIDALQSRRESFGAARTKFRETQAAVEQAAKAMRMAEGPAKALSAEYKRTVDAVSRASSAFEKQKGAVLQAKQALESFGMPINKIAAEQKRLRTVISETTSALEKQAVAERHAGSAAGRGRAGHGGGHGDGTLAGMIGFAVAHGAGHAAHRVVETYSDFDRERRYGQVVMGITDAQQQPLIAQAIGGAGSSRFNDIQWLESQRELAARGYNREQVMGFAPVAAQLGQAFDVSMPEGVKLLEGALLGFKKDTSTRAAAAASAQRTADLQVKASKISGMSAEDIQSAYKFAASPAQMAGLSEEQMLAFAAISKKANMGGDESGTAIRALGKNLLSPTAGAKVAMRAAGVDYNKYQRMPDSLDTGGFVEQVAQQYGVKLDSKAQAGLSSIFHNKSLIGNASAFMPAVLGILDDVLGGDDAKSKHKIAGLASRYRDASSLGVDSNGLLSAVMTAMAKNPALANSIFGSKQGGRIFTAMGDPKFFSHIFDELLHESQGYAQKVSDARMQGFYANLQKLGNSMLNVETAVGRAFDANGSGGMLTNATGAVAGFAQRLAEADPIILRTGTEFAAAAAGVAAWKGINLAQDILGGLKGLGKGAIALEAGTIGAEGAALTLSGALTVGTLTIAGAAAVAVIDALSHSGKKRLASDDPNFGNPLLPMQMPMGPIGTLPPSQGGGRGQEPASIDKRNLPGHWITARGGIRQWVVDAAPAPFHGIAPAFARGIAGAAALPLVPFGDLPIMKRAMPTMAGMGMLTPGTTFGGSPIGEKQGPLTAKLEGQALVGITIKVDGPGQVTNQTSYSSGNVSVGTSMPSARAATNGRVAGPV